MAMYFVHPEELHKFKEHYEEDASDHVLTVKNHQSSGPIPRLNVVILIVGSRGDVQPFIALGKGLQKAGHRVRLASHINFRQFVNENGLEYYPLKGDPEHLMNFMVKNPDMITLDAHEIITNQNMMEDIYNSTWDACTAGGFQADVIVSNPPVHVHVHLHQRLQIPLYVMFTMPWSPTTDYMHPLAPMQRLWENKTSYTVVDQMIWFGLGTLQNNFRKRIGLHPVSRGSNLVQRLRIPHMYCMSPHLAPKPTDWGPHIDVVGFWYLDLKTSFTPPDDLVAFLKAGPKPIYIGFGSIVVDDPKKLSETVIEGIKLSGQRALVSSGWAKIGQGMDLPDTIKIIGNAPHDWLFTECAAVCHHGGAGTTAAGLKAGCPTIVVPFFGDQPFWGSCVANMGVGPKPIPHKSLTKQNLADAIKFCMTPDVQAKAQELSRKLTSEDGVQTAVESFEKRLPVVNGLWQVEVYENSRKIPIVGWGHHLMMTDPKPYSDETGHMELDLARFECPAGWEWVSDWTPTVVANETDAHGWRYASSFGRGSAHHVWHHEDGHTHLVRTRHLVRQRKFTGHVSEKEQPKLLYVQVLEAKGLPSMDVVGQSDPFCVIEVHGRIDVGVQKTKTINDNNNPNWNETLWFSVLPSDELAVVVWDEDPVGKDEIGRVHIPLADVLKNEIGKDKWYTLKGKKHHDAGQIRLGFSF